MPSLLFTQSTQVQAGGCSPRFQSLSELGMSATYPTLSPILLLLYAYTELLSIVFPFSKTKPPSGREGG